MGFRAYVSLGLVTVNVLVLFACVCTYVYVSVYASADVCILYTGTKGYGAGMIWHGMVTLCPVPLNAMPLCFVLLCSRSRRRSGIRTRSKTSPPFSSQCP